VQEPPYNLRGGGFTAGIWDGGSVKFHPDLNYSGKTILGEDNGVSEHAVHVAGTMLGGGNISNQYRGISPDSRAVSYDFGFINQFVPDFDELFRETNESVYEYDAVVSQNSWGSISTLGEYTTGSGKYDSIVSGNTSKVSDNIPVVFSAGNNGSEGYNSTSAPGGTSKNAITVGSVGENRKNSKLFV
jgi:hypothetical protein